MAAQTIVGTPVTIMDDGSVYIFGVVDSNNNPLIQTTGFLHRPVSASEAFGSPPVTWSAFSDLDTWTETIKYAVRNNRQIRFTYDDSTTNSYTASDGSMFQLSVLYAVND